MLRVAATCVGISPYLMNPVTDAVLDEVAGRTPKEPKRSDMTVEEEAALKLWRDAQGRFGLPAENLFASMMGAGRKVKFGTGLSKVSTAESSVLPAVASIEQVSLPFKDDPKWVVDKRRGVGKQGTKKVLVCIIRPKFPTWSFDVNFLLDDEEMGVNTLQEVLRIAGKFVGVGDFRPSTKGPFGRFRIAHWEVLGEVTDD